MEAPSALDLRVAELPDHGGVETRLRGWLLRGRGKGKLLFLLLRDGSGVCQCVVSRSEVSEKDFAAAKELTQESSFEVTGTVHLDERAPGGAELRVTALRCTQRAESYPISPKEHGSGFLLDHRHLWLRSSRQTAILRLRHRLIHSFRNYLDGEGFFCVDSPIFTPNACEGTSTLFETDYFGEKAYLTQSGQLYAEAVTGGRARGD